MSRGPSGASPGDQPPSVPGQLSQRSGRGCRLQAGPGLVSSSCPIAQTPRLWSFHSCTWGAPDPGSRHEAGARLREPSRCHTRRTPRRGGRTGSMWPSPPGPQQDRLPRQPARLRPYLHTGGKREHRGLAPQPAGVRSQHGRPIPGRAMRVSSPAWGNNRICFAGSGQLARKDRDRGERQPAACPHQALHVLPNPCQARAPQTTSRRPFCLGL